MMYYTVYKITNKINNKFYIGMHITKEPNDNYFGSGKLIRQAIKKYGIDNFEKELLHIFDNEIEMKAKEEELVTEEFCKRNDVYNLCNGGKGGFGYINRSGIPKFKGKKHSEESKRKMSHFGNKNLLGYNHTKETKQRISNTLLGYKRTKESIEKQKESWRKKKIAGLV